MKNRTINHIKAHPDVYVGLCGVRHDSVGPEVGFVMAASGMNRCQDCLKKAVDPGYQKRRMERALAMVIAQRSEIKNSTYIE